MGAAERAELAPAGNLTLAEALQAAGYRTMMAGKWHNGSAEGRLPWQRGFQRYRGLLSGSCNYFNPGLPQLCTVCQIPMGFTEPGDPMTQCQRQSVYEGERYDFCSDGCQWIFDREPTKYRQSWLPVHQIFQGNCGGPTLPDVAAWYGLQPGDGGEYLGSPDNLNWLEWHGQTPKEA